MILHPIQAALKMLTVSNSLRTRQHITLSQYVSLSELVAIAVTTCSDIPGMHSLYSTTQEIEICHAHHSMSSDMFILKYQNQTNFDFYAHCFLFFKNNILIVDNLYLHNKIILKVSFILSFKHKILPSGLNVAQQSTK